MSLGSMEDLFLNELKDVYSAEKQIVRALPRMAKAASSLLQVMARSEWVTGHSSERCEAA